VDGGRSSVVYVRPYARPKASGGRGEGQECNDSQADAETHRKLGVHQGEGDGERSYAAEEQRRPQLHARGAAPEPRAGQEQRGGAQGPGRGGQRPGKAVRVAPGPERKGAAAGCEQHWEGWERWTVDGRR